MFIEKLNKRIDAVDSMLCVGLDPDLKRLPAHLTKDAEGVLQFCCAIVDATAPYVCAFKPQIAYFAGEGLEKTLEQVIAYIHEKHPDIAVILDAKRGDIGSTAKQYAKEAFVRYQADAVTLSPYMGFDTVEPYFEYEGRGVILLCRTSNPGGADIEELVTKDGEIAKGLGSCKVSWTFSGNKITGDFIYTVPAQVTLDKLRLVVAIGSPHTEYHVPMSFAIGPNGLGVGIEKDDFQANWLDTEVVTENPEYRSYWGNIHYLQVYARNHPMVLRPGVQYRLTLSLDPDIIFAE